LGKNIFCAILFFFSPKKITINRTTIKEDIITK